MKILDSIAPNYRSSCQVVRGGEKEGGVLPFVCNKCLMITTGVMICLFVLVCDLPVAPNMCGTDCATHIGPRESHTLTDSTFPPLLTSLY
ncbi:hypothetical protein X798_07227 [Onchocerca flexuosa]|uniref:Uncharacterized protein n=1 Tax=Onchocerca flexuosa TaxID=387005 RepID=A0A238BK22_9BILA|nr:hypothetical protein X798_07227 [Onchocerca flexuosa]